MEGENNWGRRVEWFLTLEWSLIWPMTSWSRVRISELTMASWLSLPCCLWSQSHFSPFSVSLAPVSWHISRLCKSFLQFVVSQSRRAVGSGHTVYLNLRLFLFQIWYTSYLVHFVFPYAHQTPFTNIKCIVFISVYFSTKWLHITAYPKWTFRERMAPGLVDRLNKKERNMGKESCRALLGSILVLS